MCVKVPMPGLPIEPARAKVDRRNRVDRVNVSVYRPGLLYGSLTPFT